MVGWGVSKPVGETAAASGASTGVTVENWSHAASVAFLVHCCKEWV